MESFEDDESVRRRVYKPANSVERASSQTARYGTWKIAPRRVGSRPSAGRPWSRLLARARPPLPAPLPRRRAVHFVLEPEEKSRVLRVAPVRLARLLLRLLPLSLSRERSAEEGNAHSRANEEDARLRLKDRESRKFRLVATSQFGSWLLSVFCRVEPSPID